MAYPIEKGQRQVETAIPIQTLNIGSGCMPDMISQFLDESKLRKGNMDQYVQSYMEQECKPPRECEVTLD